MKDLTLRDYQVADLAFYMATPCCGNFSDPGVGKTAPTCVYIWFLWDQKAVRTIWAMPKTLLRKNRDEILLWSDFTEEDVVIVDGTPKQREKQMSQDAKVFIMGYDCFANNWPQIVEKHPDIDCLVGDEWHLAFKSDSSKRTKSMYDFMDRTTFLVVMTGTIIDGRLDSAYPSSKSVRRTVTLEAGGASKWRMPLRMTLEILWRGVMTNASARSSRRLLSDIRLRMPMGQRQRLFCMSFVRWSHGNGLLTMSSRKTPCSS
jgi:hypothetical protein